GSALERRLLTSAIVLAAVRPGDFGQPRHRHDPLAVAELEDHYPLAAAAGNADVVDRAANHHAGIGDQHDLVVMPDREDRDNRVLPAGQVHIVDALTAAPGDAVVIGRAAHAEALLGDALKEFLARREIEELLFRDRRLAAVCLAFLGFERLLGGLRLGRLALLAHLAAPFRRKAQIGVAHIGRDLPVSQDRHRDDLVVAEQTDAAHPDRGTARKDPYPATGEPSWS